MGTKQYLSSFFPLKQGKTVSCFEFNMTLYTSHSSVISILLIHCHVALGFDKLSSKVTYYLVNACLNRHLPALALISCFPTCGFSKVHEYKTILGIWQLPSSFVSRREQSCWAEKELWQVVNRALYLIFERLVGKGDSEGRECFNC